MDLQAYRGHKPKRRKFNKGSVKGQLAALEQQVSVLQSNPRLGLLRRQPNLTPLHLQMPPPTLKM